MTGMKYLHAANLDRLTRSALEIRDKVDVVRSADGPCMVDDALFGLEVDLEMMLNRVRGLRTHLGVVHKEVDRAEIG